MQGKSYSLLILLCDNDKCLSYIRFYDLRSWGGNAFVNGKNAFGLIAYGAEYLSSDELFQSSSSIGAITQTLKIALRCVDGIYLVDVDMKGVVSV